jgi:hypothetical protein
MFLLEFWIFFRQKVSSQATLHTYLGPQRIFGDMRFEAPNALKVSALSNNPDLEAAGALRSKRGQDDRVRWQMRGRVQP